MRLRLIGVIATLVLALIGSVVLIAYVRNADARAMAGVRTMDVLVVTETVAEGTPTAELADAVAAESVPAKVVAAGAVSSLDELAGQVTTAELHAGEQVLTSRFADPDDVAARGVVEIPDGLQQVTVSLAGQRVVGGQLVAGDTVGFFASFSDGEDGEDSGATTHQILHKVLVSVVQYDGQAPAQPEEVETEDGQPEASADAPAPPGGSVLVTFAVSAADAERIVFAAEHGSIWLTTQPDSAPESGTQVQRKETIYQ